MKKPNILLIIADQHRADTIGFRGTCDTPNIDSLINRGISFDRAVTPAPLCGPARTSIFTGKYPHEAKGVLLKDKLGVRTEEDYPLNVLRDMMINDSSVREKSLLTDLLKAKGYYTAYAGKWHLGNDIITSWFDKAYGYDNNQYVKWCKDNGLPDGWPLHDSTVKTDRIPHMSIPVTKVNNIEPENTNDAWIADIAIHYIKDRPKNKPFFMVCGFNGPHPPFKIPEPYYSMYNPDKIPEPPNFKPTRGEPVTKKKSFYRTLWEDHGNEWVKWQKSVAVYRGFVSLIDHEVGRLTTTLKEENILDDTVIIYCSDHGEMLGQHGLWHKMQAYEESLRVPLIISAPWLAKGMHSNALVSLIDIPTTILSFAGIETPKYYEGKDLKAVIKHSGKINGRNYLFSEQEPLGRFHKEVAWRMVTDNKLKYIWNNGDTDELYDLKADPYEKENLVENPTYQEALKQLKNVLGEWIHSKKDPLEQRFLKDLEA